MSETAAAALRTLTSWKLDVINTANADPILKKHSAAFRLLVLSLRFVRQDSRTAFVTNTVARVQANIRSAETLSAARKALISAGYFHDTGKRTSEGAVVYEIRNPRQELVAIFVREASEVLKEQETFRKEEERRKVRQKRQATTELEPEPCELSSASIIEDPFLPDRFDDRTDSPSMIEDEHLEPTPGSYSHRKGRLSSGPGFRDTWEVHKPVLRPFSEIQAHRGPK